MIQNKDLFKSPNIAKLNSLNQTVCRFHFYKTCGPKTLLLGTYLLLLGFDVKTSFLSLSPIFDGKGKKQRKPTLKTLGKAASFILFLGYGTVLTCFQNILCTANIFYELLLN